MKVDEVNTVILMYVVYHTRITGVEKPVLRGLVQPAICSDNDSRRMRKKVGVGSMHRHWILVTRCAPSFALYGAKRVGNGVSWGCLRRQAASPLPGSAMKIVNTGPPSTDRFTRPACSWR